MHSLYRFYAEDDTLLYVGQSRNPFQRLAGHFAQKDMTQVRCIEVEWFDTAADAINAESWAIRREKPLWNIMAPVKPRKVRVSPKSAPAKKASELPPTKPPAKHYDNVGPYLPPMLGPPKPWKQFAVNLTDEEVPNVKLDFTFEGGEAAIRRAFKVARAGDVIHLKAGVEPIYYESLAGAERDQPYVQHH